MDMGKDQAGLSSEKLEAENLPRYDFNSISVISPENDNDKDISQELDNAIKKIDTEP
jgi:hypothetical protein